MAALFGKNKRMDAGPVTLECTGETWGKDAVTLHLRLAEVRLTMREYEDLPPEAQEDLRGVVRFVESSELEGL